jgi:hypothetical protein
MLDLALQGCEELFVLQRAALDRPVEAATGTAGGTV